MDYDSRFLHNVAELAQVEIEECIPLAMEAYEQSVERERYVDAALIIMLACRCLRTHDNRVHLLNKLAGLDSWKGLRQVGFFATWLSDSDLAPIMRPRMRYDDSQSHWIETDDNTDEGLLSACKIMFADLLVGQQERPGLGGMNLLFFLNRSRRRAGLGRIHNPASFGLRYIAPASEEEQNTLLGRVERGQLRICSVRLGTVGPQTHEE